MKERDRDEKGRFMKEEICHSSTRESRAYAEARGRCNNPHRPTYRYYGGRGIEFKFASYDEFYDELGPCSDGLTLDRYPNNNGHYEKGNVRWASRKEQANNRRANGEAIHQVCELRRHKKGYRGPCKRCSAIYSKSHYYSHKLLKEYKQYTQLLDGMANAIFNHLDSNRGTALPATLLANTTNTHWC
jgi:hypothetical protein